MTTTRSTDMPAEDRRSTERAIERLRSLHAGEIAVLEAAACGPRIVPELRRLLFSRESSGLFEVRVRAVFALAKLRAHGTLLDFLRTRQTIADPVAQLGEDAVISAAALAMVNCDAVGLFDVLMELAKRPGLPGVIFALGATRRAEAIPVLVSALSEDTSRLTAERALIRFGRAAQPALMEVITGTSGTSSQSESQLRQRRSAIRLLSQMGISFRTNHWLGVVIDDPDPKIAIVASAIALRSGSNPDKRRSIRRLLQLFVSAGWQDREDIERSMAANAATVRLLMHHSSSLQAPGDASLALLRRILG